MDQQSSFPSSEHSQSQSQSQSVTDWIGDLKRGDQRASQKIWDRYIANLIRVANRKLGAAQRRVADAEDVVVMAFTNFLSHVERGGFSQLNDRDDLWQILVMLTERRAIDQIRRQNPKAPAKTFGESAVGRADSKSSNFGLDDLAGDTPTPAFAVLALEQFERKLNLLGDEILKQIAIAKMNGDRNQEIAEQLNISLRSVERKLAFIRDIWQRDSDDE